jgi:hypothetical protein
MLLEAQEHSLAVRFILEVHMRPSAEVACLGSS